MNSELLKELKFLTSRSSGPGGQHVNKTESKVELHWNLFESNALTEEKRSVLMKKLANKLTGEGVLILVCQETRSQIKNREIVINRFLAQIEELLKPSKKRFKTKPTRASVERRIQAKKKNAERKRDRGKPGLE